jgi:hypothetical protein
MGRGHPAGNRLAPAGTVMAAYLARDDVRDYLVHPGGLRIEQLPSSTRIALPRSGGSRSWPCTGPT